MAHKIVQEKLMNCKPFKHISFIHVRIYKIFVRENCAIIISNSCFVDRTHKKR